MADAQEFPYIPSWKRVIIATKGLPCTGKSELAGQIGKWARCQVLYVDDFLSAFSLDKGYNSSDKMPSEEEAERLHRLAFDALCTSFGRYFRSDPMSRYDPRRCVVVKSRLCSTFELDRLLRLPTKLPRFEDNVTIIIIECHVKNELRLYDRLENYIKDEEWYKARTRLDFEKARDDDWLSTTCTSTSHPAARDEWDLHLCNLLTNINDDNRLPTRVIRLVLDPFLHLDLCIDGMRSLTPAFQAAIRYLIKAHMKEEEEEEVDWKQEPIRDWYAVVHFDKLRRYLAELELKSADKKKNPYLCPTSSNSERALGGRCCVFKTYTPTKHHQDQDYDAPDDDDCNLCGVCDQPVQASSDEEEGVCYTCHFCFLTLHKSCAEYQDGVTFQADFRSIFPLKYYPRFCDYYLQGRTHACKSCKEGGRSFSGRCDACLFQTHLKCRLFPTVINHDSHPQHLLSLQAGLSSWFSNCKACGDYRVGKYGCYVCGLDCCLRCVLRPTKLEHTHGGHHHALDLVYTRDGTEPQEDYWCGVCSEDMDPDYWFYSCQDCPSYEAHPECIMPSGSRTRHTVM